MANITNVDYVAIPAQAQNMRALGQELNNELSTAYQSIANMHNCWYGKRYNELVKEFNNMVQQINELLELVVGEIPFALETIANNYSQADQGSNITSAAKTAPKMMPAKPAEAETAPAKAATIEPIKAKEEPKNTGLRNLVNS